MLSNIAITIIAVSCVFFIVLNLDKKLLHYNYTLLNKYNHLNKENELLLISLRHICNQLKLSLLETCPKEEKERILSEICTFIEEIDRLKRTQNNAKIEK